LYDNLKVKSIAFPDEENALQRFKATMDALAPPLGLHKLGKN